MKKKSAEFNKGIIDDSFFDENYFGDGDSPTAGYNGLLNLEGMNRDMAKDFAPIFGLKKGDRVLDLGCAAGMMVSNWQQAGIDACGIDISRYAIEWGRKRYGLDKRIFCGSIHDLSRWPDDSFDFIFSQQVFEHLPAALCKDLAAECFRVHKPGGRMWVGLVLRHPSIAPETEVIDKDPSHQTMQYKEWWDRLFCDAGYRLYWDLEIAMIERSAMWKKLRWHQLAYLKPRIEVSHGSSDQ